MASMRMRSQCSRSVKVARSPRPAAAVHLVHVTMHLVHCPVLGCECRNRRSFDEL